MLKVALKQNFLNVFRNSLKQFMSITKETYVQSVQTVSCPKFQNYQQQTRTFSKLSST